MELRLSNLAKTYPASGIRKMFDLAAGYDDVIALTLGEPNFETPAYIKEAAKKALDENYTHYAPNAGLPVLREAIAKRYQKSHWAGYKAENVIVTVGALEGLTRGMLALLTPGDEIRALPTTMVRRRSWARFPCRCRLTRRTAST